MTRVFLTPQEVSALLQGLRRSESDFKNARPEPAPEHPQPPAARVLAEARGGLGLQKISHWWAAVARPQWPQFSGEGLEE